MCGIAGAYQQVDGEQTTESWVDVAALLQDDRSGREDRSNQLWQLLTLEFWYRQTRQAGVGL